MWEGSQRRYDWLFHIFQPIKTQVRKVILVGKQGRYIGPNCAQLHIGKYRPTPNLAQKNTIYRPNKTGPKFSDMTRNNTNKPKSHRPVSISNHIDWYRLIVQHYVYLTFRELTKSLNVGSSTTLNGNMSLATIVVSLSVIVFHCRLWYGNGVLFSNAVYILGWAWD